MSEVRDNTPSPAAAAPSHPHHPRWLKERTLALEVAHQGRIGGTLRDAESVNAASLQRLEAKKRARPVVTPSLVEKIESSKRREARREKLGVSYKPVAKVLVVPAKRCKSCGLCLVCRRELRISIILAKGREGDLEMQWLADNLVALTFAMQKRIDCKISPNRRARGKEVAFSRMILGGERNTAFCSAVAEICDWSSRALGAWR